MLSMCLFDKVYAKVGFVPLWKLRPTALDDCHKIVISLVSTQPFVASMSAGVWEWQTDDVLFILFIELQFCVQSKYVFNFSIWKEILRYKLSQKMLWRISWFNECLYCRFFDINISHSLSGTFSNLHTEIL